MKVLLLGDIKKLGKKYDVKNVSDGYARNFLIPQKLAMPADGAALALKARQDEAEKRAEDNSKRQAERLQNEILEFWVKTDEGGGVFGSVTAGQIGKALQNKEYEISEVILKQPLKSLGDHEVEVKFGRGINGKAKVRISPL